MTAKKIINYLISVFVGFALGVLVNIPSCQKQPEVKIEYIKTTDTITKTEVQIKEKTQIKYIDRLDTCYVTVGGDTVYIKDLPIEHKEYNDTLCMSDSVKANINILYSGYNAKIDSFNLTLDNYKEVRTITAPAKKFGWDVTIGPSIGYGIAPTTTGFKHGMYFGASIVIGPSFRISK